MIGYFLASRCSTRFPHLVYKETFVHYPAIGMNLVDLPMGVQLVSHVWSKDPEALAAFQQAIQVVMVVMMKPAG